MADWRNDVEGGGRRGILHRNGNKFDIDQLVMSPAADESIRIKLKGMTGADCW